MWNQLLLPILTGSIPEKTPNFLKNPGIILEISGKNLKNIFIKDPQKLFNDLEISGKILETS